ncbi:signal recognition particle protein [Anaplasma phagocytophilum]|uniref:signal-recognition-particle GTPase n=4 Tax=Anaplasma phagocytophilum TaxID=948 RepID=A0A168H7A5_ANAPH|nr:signal recognition particle protein [Anaplasma phagocytophilum]KJV64357.1 signal recognition particle protein [Anaplasma phagocytophilum str. ApMUC09]ANC34082.1 signal recognition particle protein [Anaplasma phagocytophilum str. Norway variant2]EOA63144.1 signal recognition particle protein [Anaplasma phagocytophilum str. CRT38]KDB57476.1 signal recognition particle [Anaplasma phagocytophilum str. CRT35]KJV87521.1 signal recognition particle protein [Anaplasma phagocytophilum str. CRT53-1]
MFNSLTKGFSSALQRLSGKREISSKDFDLVIEDITQALLDADVNLGVVDEFIENVKSKIVGGDVVKGVLPEQMVIKRIEECLIEVLGNEKSALDLKGKVPAVIMMVGLQGVGKTTNTVKVALRLKKDSKNPLVASLDVYRPAAREQLKVLADGVGIDSLPIVEEQKPLDIAKRAMREARLKGHDVVLLDTAGRLHINQDMIDELKCVKKEVSPAEIILVVDSLMGQDAVTMVRKFNEELGITGTIFTRADGDPRGGAILSMKLVAGCPIKFMSTGEKPEDLDDFYPDRIARRMLNMGDVASLVEKAVEAVGKDTINELQAKAKKGKFDLDDLVIQLKALNKMGGIANIMKFIPAFGNDIKRKVAGIADDSKVDMYIAIINSMTKQERANPEILNGARKARIAKGAGVKVDAVNALLKQYNQMNSMISKFSQMKMDKIADSDIMNLLKGK